jgi:hypothetical protein
MQVGKQLVWILHTSHAPLCAHVGSALPHSHARLRTRSCRAPLDKTRSTAMVFRSPLSESVPALLTAEQSIGGPLRTSSICAETLASESVCRVPPLLRTAEEDGSKS